MKKISSLIILIILMLLPGLLKCASADTVTCPCCDDQGARYCPADERPDSNNEDKPSSADVVYVSGEPFARLRADASTKNPYLAKMPFGSKVTLLSSTVVEGVSWSHIVYNGQRGYCMSKYLSDRKPYYDNSLTPQTMEDAFGTSMLQRGNRYPDHNVKNLQLCLIEAGYLSADPGADGLFGSKTEKALIAYQKANHMDPVGRAGNTTKTKLWELYAFFLQESGVIQ